MSSPELFAVYPDLRGRSVLVTGAGQPAGIGAATCRLFAKQGCDLFFTYRSVEDRRYWSSDSEEENAAALVSDLRAYGVRAECLGIDLGLPESPRKVLDSAYDAHGGLSILVNNAAHSTRDGFETLDAEGLDAHYFVNVRATALLSVGFAKRFGNGSGGRIINLSSGQDLGPMPGELAYVVSKGAITAFTRSLAKGVAGKGITVNAVDPGPTDTGWMSAEQKGRLAMENAFGRVGTADDAARIIVFLASKAAEWISGEVIHARGA